MTSESTADRALRWCLLVVVLVQCAGYLGQALLGETEIFEFLFLVADLSESTSEMLAGGGTMVVFGLAVGLFFVPSPIAALLIAGWFFFSAVADMRLGGAPFSHLAILSHSIRYLSPVALALLMHRGGDSADGGSETWLVWLLQLGVGATFLAHGWEALEVHPRFVDYLLLASRRLLGTPLAESSATTLLVVIGAVDVLVAILALAGLRHRYLLWYMAAWGAIAALARMVHGGFWAFPSTFVRAANGGGPLAYYLAIRSEESSASDDATADQP